MKINPVVNCTLIIRSQAEYSAAAQTVILRCILEKPATGQHRGFTNVEVLLTVLRAELIELQNQLIPPDQQNLENSAVIGVMLDAPESAPLTKGDSVNRIRDALRPERYDKLIHFGSRRAVASLAMRLAS